MRFNDPYAVICNALDSHEIQNTYIPVLSNIPILLGVRRSCPKITYENQFAGSQSAARRLQQTLHRKKRRKNTYARQCHSINIVSIFSISRALSSSMVHTPYNVGGRRVRPPLCRHDVLLFVSLLLVQLMMVCACCCWACRISHLLCTVCMYTHLMNAFVHTIFECVFGFTDNADNNVCK